MGAALIAGSAIEAVDRAVTMPMAARFEPDEARAGGYRAKLVLYRRLYETMAAARARRPTGPTGRARKRRGNRKRRMRMSKLRLGMIGAGAWCVASHLPRLEKHRDAVEFTAVNRRDPVLLETVRSRFGFASAHTDYRGVLEAEPDIVVVASPVRWHHEHAKAALEAGAHVLVEKPFTVHPDEARDLVATAAANDRHLLIALGWHYKDIVIGAKRLMETGGGVGTVESISIVMSSTTREALQGVQPSFASDQDEGGFVSAKVVPELTPRPETLVDPGISGGGYAQAQLSHAIGLGLWLSGLRGAEVFAMMSSPLDTPVEYHDAWSVRFDTGAIGSVSGASSHLGHNGNKHHLEVQIIGSEGQLHVESVPGAGVPVPGSRPGGRAGTRARRRAVRLQRSDRHPGRPGPGRRRGQPLTRRTRGSDGGDRRGGLPQRGQRPGGSCRLASPKRFYKM